MSDGEISYTPPWKNAMAVLFGPDGYDYGELIPHEVLQEALGLPEPTGRITADELKSWQLRLVTQVTALSAALLEERNMCLKSVIGQGYKIVEPEKQTAFAVKQGQQELRTAMQKMGRRLSYLDRSALTAEQAKENADALARLSFLQTQMSTRQRIAAPVWSNGQATTHYTGEKSK